MKIVDKIKYLFSLAWLDFSSTINDTMEAAIFTDMWVNGYTDLEIDQVITEYRESQDVE